MRPQEADFAKWAEPLLKMVGERFRIHSVFVVRATAVEPIVAPSYRFYPHETTEASQIEAALQAYGVRRSVGESRRSFSFNLLSLCALKKSHVV